MSNETDEVATLQSPKKRLPPGACDTHAHVFGPYDRFPLAEPRPYTPVASPFDRYSAMLEAMGFDRGVLVHGGAHGWDHSAMLDAIARAPDRLRGVGVVPADEEAEELGRLHAAGIRGLRFTEVAGPNASQNFAGRVDLNALYALAPKMQDLGWHAVIWANASVFETHANKLRTLGIPIVIDHLGYFDVTQGVDDSAFRAVRDLVEDGIAYIKLTAFRNSKQAPLHEDVEPYHRALVEANPERILWGSDWPFLGMNTYRPEPGALLDLMDRWIEDEGIKELALVKNPERLYFST
jgi:2-pyrone-4,6-dicarboxylate lactonase